MLAIWALLSTALLGLAAGWPPGVGPLGVGRGGRGGWIARLADAGAALSPSGRPAGTAGSAVSSASGAAWAGDSAEAWTLAVTNSGSDHRGAEEWAGDK